MDPVPKLEFIEHHRAHLASAFFSSPFEEATLYIQNCNTSHDVVAYFIGINELVLFKEMIKDKNGIYRSVILTYSSLHLIYQMM